ncbi:MAG: hypothetical protein KF810_09435 [Rhizobiaceae bacterium]|nr:hypothetical protein [Rhizobiaceae bacterium]
MTIARNVFSAGAVVGLSFILAGCLGGGGGTGGGTRPAPSGVEGTWIDAQGTGLSTISGGTFSTVATDTGQKLAEGSYLLSSPTSVQITGTSLIRQAPISFNCLLVSGNQLNCTSSAGQQFVLTRRA